MCGSGRVGVLQLVKYLYKGVARGVRDGWRRELVSGLIKVLYFNFAVCI